MHQGWLQLLKPILIHEHLCKIELKETEGNFLDNFNKVRRSVRLNGFRQVVKNKNVERLVFGDIVHPCCEDRLAHVL